MLTVLLTGTVSALIYTHLYTFAGACRGHVLTATPDIKETVHFVNENQVRLKATATVSFFSSIHKFAAI